MRGLGRGREGPDDEPSYSYCSPALCSAARWRVKRVSMQHERHQISVLYNMIIAKIRSSAEGVISLRNSSEIPN